MSTSRRTTVCALALLAAAVGCKPSGNVSAFLQARERLVATAEYRVYPPDVIAISSMQVAEINGATQRVRPDGRLNLPLVGEVDVAGKTPAEIAKAIELAASKYYAEVDATVEVIGYNSQQFYIFGEVGRPGPMAWTGCDTVLDALSLAQPTQYSWPQRIRLIRAKQPQRGGEKPPSKEKLKEMQEAYKAEGKNKVGANELTIDLAAMFKKGDMSRNVLLRPGDILYVPQNPLARTAFFIQQILFPVNEVLAPLSVYASARADLDYVTNPQREE